MRKLLFLIGFVYTGVIVKAQTEGRIPLQENVTLNSFRPSNTSSIDLGKKAIALPAGFPITEQFAYTRPDTLFWQDSNVNIVLKAAIFNAQSFSGGTYNSGNGSFGITDVLTTRSINFLTIPDRCYINFDYESGSSWQVGDSLVLQALNSAGNWDHIWTSVPINTSRRNVSFAFPIGLLYQHATLQLRFVSYSASLAANTETFRLFNFVFALKPVLPYYENAFWDSIHTYRYSWSKMQGSKGVDAGISWGNVIRLDGYDENGNAYNNGFNDTIQSHSYDFSGFALSDSVSFRFYYKALSTINSDSLILQFKNNGGLWVNQMAASAAQNNSWRKFDVSVNRSRFNHSDFQFRIVTRSSSIQSDTLKWVVSGFNISQKRSLPFLDDFSATNIYPDERKWLDKLVFVNHNFPIAPPSINVATFDGLNRVGVPYGTGKGYCDTLTSLPIRLDRLTQADSGAVYLSFWIQPQGLGSPVENGDSLLLEVRYTEASPDSFRLLWRTSPFGLRTDTFTQVRILLDKQYWHDSFQLRFRNKGSRSGNLSHWHLDYVFLDKERTETDAVTDVAIQDYPSPLLKKYLSVPYEHFKQAPLSFLNDTQYFAARNNSLQAYAVNYGREIFDQELNRIDTFGTLFNNFTPLSTQVGTIKRTVNITNHYPTDSAVIWSRFYTQLGTTSEVIRDTRANDTLWQPTYLGNYYAYDDGTAESGYAILNGPGKVALRYVFNQPDTLYGVSVFYNRGVTDVSSLSFNLMVWSEISPENVLRSIPARAVYYNARNGFHYVKFEEPVYVTGTVYIGWEQNQTFPLNVGFDLNYKVDYQYKPNPEMFFNLGGGWEPTQLWGALMMRPIVGKWIDPPPVGLAEKNITALDVIAYPNPTTGVLHIRSNSQNQLRLSVFDITGKEVYQAADGIETIDLSHLCNGLYFVRVEDRVTRASKTTRVLINH